MMEIARDNEFFWLDYDEDKDKKPVGWLILGDEYNEEQKTEEQVSDFSEELNPSDLEEGVLHSLQYTPWRDQRYRCIDGTSKSKQL